MPFFKKLFSDVIYNQCQHYHRMEKREEGRMKLLESLWEFVYNFSISRVEKFTTHYALLQIVRCNLHATTAAAQLS